MFQFDTYKNDHNRNVKQVQPAPSMTLLVYSDPSKTVFSDPPKFSVLERGAARKDHYKSFWEDHYKPF